MSEPYYQKKTIKKVEGDNEGKSYKTYLEEAKERNPHIYCTPEELKKRKLDGLL